MIWYIESVISWFIINAIIILMTLKLKPDRLEKMIEMKINAKFAISMALIASLIPVIRIFFVAELIELLVLSDKDFEECMKDKEKQ